MVALFASCAPDDQEFNILALTPRHQVLFRQAGEDLNSSEPDAVFYFDNPGANSSAYYGETNPGAIATTRYYGFGIIGWKIAFQPASLALTNDCLYWLSVHELKHVLRYGHGPRNPSTWILCEN